jgi:hypothetical protein
MIHLGTLDDIARFTLSSEPPPINAEVKQVKKKDGKESSTP